MDKHNGSTDATQLAQALTDRVKNTVGARALGQAELRLEAGTPDLIAVGLDVAQKAARQLGHRILFLPRADGDAINICP